MKDVNLRNAVAATFARQLIVLGIGLVSASIVSRTLGAEQYGQYTLAILGVQFANTIFSLSVPATVIYYTERYRQADHLAQLFGSAIALEVAALTIMVVLMSFAWHFNIANIQSIYVGHLILLGVLLLAQMGNASLESFLIGLRNYEWFNGLQLATPLLFLVGILCFLSPEGNWNNVVFIQTLSVFTMFPVYLFVVKRIGLPWPQFSTKSLRQILTYGRYLWIANLLGVANVRVQYLLLESLLGLRILGQYALANQFAEKLWVPGQAAATILFPERAASANKNALFERRQGLRIAIANMLLVFVGTITLYFFMSWFGTRIFGSEFADLSIIVMGLGLGIITWAGVKILAAELAGRGHSMDNGLISLTSLIFGVLGLWLGSRLGVLGAALGVSMGYSAGFILAFVLFFWRTRSD